MSTEGKPTAGTSAKPQTGHPPVAPEPQPVAVILPDAPPWDRAVLQRLGLRGLHCGCGPQLHARWLNTDRNRLTARDGSAGESGRLLCVRGHFYYLQHDATRPFPFADASFDWVYSEHFIEHIPPQDAVAWLKDVRRLLAPGGVARVTTPDLGKYVAGYQDAEGRFFAEHARRLAGMGVPDAPRRRAWMINQIFYGWGHRWLYDWEELQAAAVTAGFPRDGLRRAGFRQGLVPEVVALDQATRNDETLYVELCV